MDILGQLKAVTSIHSLRVVSELLEQWRVPLAQISTRGGRTVLAKVVEPSALTGKTVFEKYRHYCLTRATESHFY